EEAWMTDPIVPCRWVLTTAALLLACCIVGGSANADEPPVPDMRVPAGAAAIEQTVQGTGEPPRLVARFDGLGHGFVGPQGSAVLRNPSDNSLAVGPDHIVQIVNTRMAVFTRKGQVYGETGRALYGPVETRNVFRDFGGPCEEINNGDAVVRYDQLAERWLIVMPIFRRLPPRDDEPPVPRPGEPASYSLPGRPHQPGPARMLFQPEAPPPAEEQQARESARPEPRKDGGFAMCYAISTTPDPLGPYYRYEFVRPLFPDYPR